MLDTFIILVGKPHHIDALLNDWHLKEPVTLVLLECPVLYIIYESSCPRCTTVNNLTLNAKFTPSFNAFANVSFFLIADSVWLLRNLNITSTRGRTLILSSPHT